jgi:hypothetical protein
MRGHAMDAQHHARVLDDIVRVVEHGTDRTDPRTKRL